MIYFLDRYTSANLVGQTMATRGGCTFDELCNGSAQSYACDNVIDITRNDDGYTPTVREAVQMLVKHLDRCIQKIQDKRGCRLEKFYIGKTYVRKKEEVTFNHMNEDTWKFDGIEARWTAHIRNREVDYGRDGLVVLTVVTREAIHPDIQSNQSWFRQEDYALALEGRLIQNYLTDSRMKNTSLMPGRTDGNVSIGYPLYMAFKVD